MLLIPNSTRRTLLAVSINYKADLLTNSISLETSQCNQYILEEEEEDEKVNGGINMFVREKNY